MSCQQPLRIPIAGAMLLAVSAPLISRGAINVAGELVVDLRAYSLNAASPVWTNSDAAAATLGNFVTKGGANLNLATVGGQTALNIGSNLNNSVLSATQTPASLEGNSSRSVEAWVYPNSTLNGQAVVGWGRAGTATMSSFRYANNTGNGMFSGWNIDAGWSISQVGAWKHVAWTYDGTNVRGYINGVLFNTVNLSLDADYPLNTLHNLVTVGAEREGATGAFDGYVAEVRVHTGVLSAADVLNNFNQGIQTPPMISPNITGLSDQSVLVGATVNLNPSVTGTAPIGYQWRSNGVPMMGATSLTLTLPNVQLSQSGDVYSLMATNVAGAATNSMTLTVNQPTAPVFSLQPEDQDLTIGQTLTLAAAASGLPAPTYQWLKDGTNIPGAASASYVVVNVQVPDAGVYSVIVSNSVAAVPSVGAIVSVAGPDGFCMVGGTTTGGSGGPVVTVTNGTDFNTQISIAGPRVIQVQGPISIGRIFTTANKTITGIGTNAMLYGNLNLSGVTNVIIRNLRVSNPGGDGLTVWGARNVWVDHVTFHDCGDGACDINNGSDYVTVSWCKFIYPSQQEHRFTMIADGPKDLGPLTAHITLHHNWWSAGSDQRMAATSDALVHYYNNYFNCTNNSYCSNAREEAELNIENNHYSGVNNPVTVSTGTNGKIKTAGNIYSGCTGTIHPGTDTVFSPPYAYPLDPAANVPAIVQAGAGAPGPDAVPVPPKIWDGGGTDSSLATANNWSLNEYPKAYDTLVFAGATRLSPNNNFAANAELVGLAFSNNAGAFTLGGNVLNLGQSIISDSIATQTINLNLDFTYAADHYSMAREFNVSSASGSLVINGTLSGVTNQYARLYAVSKTGPGLLTLNGVNSFPGTFNFDGGLVRFNNAANLGTTNLAFDGGGLQWAGGNTTDISVTPVAINSGGATFDVGANNVTFASPVGVGGGGGLSKLGTGTLTLNGANTYSGSTLIAQGTLALGTAGAVPGSAHIILSNNAALNVSGRSDGRLTLGSGRHLTGTGSVLGSLTAGSGASVVPGFSTGTLVVTNELAFLAGSTNVMELDAASHTNDLITGMISVMYGGRLIVTNIGGALAAGDRFKLFGAGSYSGSFSSIEWPALSGSLYWTNRLAVDGSIAVVSPVNTTPASLASVVTNGTLALSWPADHTGWRLEVQTNNLAIGLGTNWTSLGYQTTNATSLPIHPGPGSVLYRLAYP